MQWFRWWNGTRRDPKYRALTKEGRCLWAALLELASEAEMDGLVHLVPGIPFSDKQLADEADIPIKLVRPTLDAMKHFHMIEERHDSIFIINFAKRQYSSDISTERVRVHRQKKRFSNVGGNSEETFPEQVSNSDETPPETETETDSETEIKQHGDFAKSRVAVEVETERFGDDSEPHRLAVLLRTEILAHSPDAKLPPVTTAGLREWASHIDRMMRLDHRQVDEIETIIRWCHRESDFWRANILSAKKLREKWDTLVLQAKRHASPTRKSNVLLKGTPKPKDYWDHITDRFGKD